MTAHSAAQPSQTGSSGADRIYPDVGDSAPDFTLTSTGGNPVSLSSFWTVKPTVFLFLRHFGCPFCRHQVALLRQDYLKFQAAGAEIVCVGQGPYKAGKAFQILMDITFPVVVAGDDLAVYRNYGLVKGTLKQLIGVNVLLRSFNALKYGIGTVEGDPKQMPGAFIVDRSGTVLFAHRALDQADNIPAPAMLTVLREYQKENGNN